MCLFYAIRDFHILFRLSHLSANFASRRANLMDMDVSVIKPSGSQNHYESFTLENGLEVIAIVDPNATKSDLSLVIRALSGKDPINAPGLAHLLEHLVSVSDSPNELFEYTSLHGGDFVAFTEHDYMCFQGSVLNGDLEGFLKMFSRHLISPNLSKCLDAEITAVDQEFELSKYLDEARLSHLRAYTCNRGHPFHGKFSWGNRDSLSKLDRTALLNLLTKFFETYFVGGCMKLVLAGKGPLNEMKRLVQCYFGSIKYGADDIPSSISVLPWGPNTVVTSLSVEDSNLLELTWMIPKSFDTVENFILTSLTHKFPGSLYRIFIDKQWIVDLSVISGHHNIDDDDTDSCDYGCTPSGRLFIISVNLTDLGLTKKAEVVGYVLKFLSFVRDNEDAPEAVRIRDEFYLMQWFAEEFFDSYSVGSDSTTLTKQISVNMLSNDVDEAVSAIYHATTYQKNDLCEFLNYLSVDKMRIHLVVKTLDKKEGFVTDPWFGILYNVSELDSKTIGEVTTAYNTAVGFRFPPANQFRPTYISSEDRASSGDSDDGASSEDGDDGASSEVGDDCASSEDGDEMDVQEDGDEMDVHEDDDDEDVHEGGDDVDFHEGGDDMDVHEGGRIVLGDDGGRVFYFKSSSIPTLKVITYLHVERGVKSSALALCYLESLNLALAATVSQGERSMLKTKVSFSGRNKLLIEIDGYGQYFISFVKAIWDIFKAFSFPPAEFQICKEKVRRSLIGGVLDPADLSNALLEKHTSDSIYAVDDMLKELNSLVFNDFTHFMADIGTKLSVEGFLSGDISRADADTVCGLFVGLKTSQLTESRDDRGDLRLHSDHIINICARKMSDGNSVAKVCFQIGDELHIAVDTALLHLFSSLIEDDITAKLRFQEHLGYSVSGETDYDLGIFSFTIVSCDYNPEFLSLKIEDYVKNLGVFLKGVSDSVFEKRKESIELSGEEESLWAHLSEQSPDGFNRSVTSCLKKIHKEDIIIFYNKWFLSKRPFSIRVWCCKLYSEYLDSINAEN